MDAPSPDGMGITPLPARNGDLIREQDKIMLVLAYLGVLALIPLLTTRDSAYVQWHAKQGLALLLCWLAYGALGCFAGLLPFPVLAMLALGLGHLGFFALALIALVKAFEPCRWRIPVVSAVADKL